MSQPFDLSQFPDLPPEVVKAFEAAQFELSVERAARQHEQAVVAYPSACRTLGQHRSTQRKVPCGAPDEERLTEDIIVLTRAHGSLRLSDDYQTAGQRLMACEPQAGRTDMATRRA